MKNSKSADAGDPYLRQDDSWKRTGIAPEGFIISPPDGKFSWIILMAACMVVVTSMTNNTVFTVSINDLIYGLNTNMATLSWALSIASGGGNFVGPLVAMVINTYSCRRSVMIGGILCSIGLVLTSYVTKVEFLLVTFGVITGIARRLINAPLQVLLSRYFKKYLGIAIGLLTASYAASRSITTPLIQMILEEYGYRGTFFLVGGFMLHVCLFASLFQPANWHYILIPDRDIENNIKSIENKEKEESKIQMDSEKQLFLSGNSTDRHGTVKDSKLYIPVNGQPKVDFCNVCAKTVNNRRLSEVSVNLESSWDIFESVSFADEHTANSDKLSSEEQPKKFCCSFVCNNRFLHSLDYSLMKEKLFYIISTESAFLQITNVYGSIFAFQYCIEVGLIPMQAAGLISSRSFAEIGGRLAGPIMITFIKMSSRSSYLTCIFLHGISLIVLTKMSSIGTIYGVGVVAGFFFGAAVGLHALWVLEIMGVKKISSLLGLTAFFQGFYWITFGPMLGWIRDSTGSYSYCLLVLGFIQFIVLLMWIVDKAITRFFGVPSRLNSENGLPVKNDKF